MSGEIDEPRAGDGREVRGLRGDETELFRAYHGRFVRTVQRMVNTSPDIVEDACNFAWMEFIRCQPDRSRGWRSWLVTTAQREAWRLHAREAAHVGLEVDGQGDLVREPADPHDVLILRSELRAALDVLAAIPERRRQVKAMQVTGYKYEEIGERLGLGYTRVNALVTEANAAIRKERARVSEQREPLAVRAERLEEFERQPPKWLTAAIGRPPGRLVSARITLPWRRAALAIDDPSGGSLSPTGQPRRSRSRMAAPRSSPGSPPFERT